jgi:hypothetical protein
MTCSLTGKHLQLRLGLGGEVKSKIVDEQVPANESDGD